MWLAHRRECGVAEAEGCVWNSDQWIDYANADQMYWLTAMFSVWMLLTNHSALVTHGKMSRGEGKGPILWPFPCCTPSVWHWMIVCRPKNSTDIYPSVLGLLQYCSLLAPCSFVALPQKNRSIHLYTKWGNNHAHVTFVCGLFTWRPLKGTTYMLLSQKIMMHISYCHKLRELLQAELPESRASLKYEYNVN